MRFSMRLKNTSTSPVTPSDESTDILTDTEELNAKSYTTLKSIDQEEIRTDQWPLILLFKDTQLEKEFADYYYVKYADRWWKRFLQLRLSLFFLTFVYTAYVYWDLTQYGFVTFHVALRLATAALMMIINLLTLITPLMERGNGYLIDILSCVFLMVALVPSGLKSVISHKFGDEYPVGFPVTIAVGFIVKNLRIYIMFPVAIAVFLTYVATFVILIGDQFLRFSLRYPVYWAVILFFNIIGYLIIYSVENFLRKQFVERKRLQNEQNRAVLENKRSEQLLQNILPAHLIPQIKNFLMRPPSPLSECIVMDKRENCSVLFSDIVSFTAYSSTTPAHEIVFMLNSQFSHFDSLSSKYRLEKVKTIGDAYFAVGNLKGDHEEHREAICDMACGMIRYIEKTNRKYGWNFRIRIGLSSGTIFAGVLGNKKFTFDCFGPTIVLAHEMEAASLPGCVHVTKDIRQQASHSHLFYDRGQNDIPPFGSMHTYILLGRKGSSSIMDEKLIMEGTGSGCHTSIPRHISLSTATSTQSMFAETPSEVHENSPLDPDRALSGTLTNPDQTTDTDTSPPSARRTLDPLAYHVFFNFFKSFAIEKEYIFESYKRGKNSVRGTIVVIAMINLFCITNLVGIHPDQSASATAIITYVFFALQLLALIILLTPLGNYALTGLVVSISSMLSNYAIFLSTLFSRTLALEYCTIFGILCVIVFHIPTNIPHPIKYTLSCSVFLYPILQVTIYGDWSVMNVSFLVAMILLMEWTAYFVDLSSRKAYILRQKTQKELEVIAEEQRKNENLVLSALPLEIAERLKKQPEATYDSIKDGSVCFANLCGFDEQLRHSSENPLPVLNVLNELFTKFDEITAFYKCSKIKSIGSTFMVVSGCPTYTSDHAIRITHLARDFMRASREIFSNRRNTIPLIDIRIGLMCGDFVAGVLGETKYLFDVFGNSVNVAARMSTTGQNGTIQSCSPMYEHLHNVFKLQDQGTVMVKGKGEMNVWTIAYDDEVPFVEEETT